MKRLFPIFTLAVIVISISSCYEVDPTIANIQVYRVDEIGEKIPVAGCDVRLYALGSLDEDFVGEPRFDTIQTTSEEGFVSFNFSNMFVGGQAGFAVLDVEASKGSLYGSGLIKIEEMITNEEEIIVE